MGLGDVTGVFSRYFIVGFFLPSFFGLALLKITLSENWLPDAIAPDTAKSFLVIGAVALLIGLLLIGIRDPLLYFISGYPFIRQTRNRLYAPVKFISDRALRNEVRRFPEAPQAGDTKKRGDEGGVR